MTGVRPSYILALILTAYALLFALFVPLPGILRKPAAQAEISLMREAVALFGLSDLSLSTEARYTRHPAVSDPVVVTMDHPGALDHFPSTLFFTPPGSRP